MWSNENLAEYNNAIAKKLEVLAHAIRLMYKSCYVAKDQVAQCFSINVLFS